MGLTGYVSTAAAASQLRRGDQIMLGTRNGDEACMVTIAKDVNPCEGVTTCNGGVDTFLWVMAEPGRPQCNPITPTTASATTSNNRDATVFVYSQWKQTYITADSPLVNNDAKRQEFSQSLGTSNTAHQASVTSLSKTSSSYYTLTAALGTDPGAASVFGRELLPGTWLRIYDETSVGNFCDVEVKATPKDNSGTSQFIHVMPATTTTYNYGYNYDATDGCTAIETTAGTYSMAVLYPYKQGPSNGNAFYFPGDATTTTYAWASNTVTVASGSTTFTQDVADNLFPGAVVGFTTSSTDMTLLCAATVATTPVAGGTTFTTTTAPTKFTTGYGVKDCADSTVTTTAAVRHMVIYGASNALFFTDDDDENPNKFSNFNAGDWVTVTGSTASVGGSSEAPVTVNVERASASSLVFSMGSKPNGGGMHSVLPARSTSNVNLPVESTYLSTGPAVTHVPTAIGSGEPGQSLLVQMYSSTAAAATDTAAIDSAAVVKRVLEELPNQALPSVAVTMTPNALSLYAYTITFSNPDGSGGTGDQHSIILNSKGCNLDGCQPRYDGVRTQYAIVDSSITVDATAGTIAGTSVATSVSGLAAGGGDVVTTYGQNVKTGESLKTSSVSSTTAVVIGKATGASAGVATFVVAKASGDVSSWTTGSGFKSVTYEVTRGSDESAECANRGNCNRDDGTCECASGYTGAACTTQTVIM